MRTLRRLLNRFIENQTMAGTIILSFLVIFLPLAACIGVLTINNARDSLKENTERSLTTLASQVSDELHRALIRPYQDIQTLANNPVISSSQTSLDQKRGELRKAWNFYDQFQEYYSMFLDIAIVGLDGKEIIYIGDPESEIEDSGIVWAEEPWFENARKKENVIIVNDDGTETRLTLIAPPSRLGDESGGVVMSYASPVVNDLGDFVAIMVGRMDMRTIWEITDGTTMGETGFSRIIGMVGSDEGEPRYMTFAHVNKEEIFSEFDRFNVAALLDPYISDSIGDDGTFDAEASYVTFDEYDEEMVAAVAPLWEEGPKWYVIVSQQKGEAFALVEDNIRDVAWGVAGLILLFVIVIILLIHRLTKPIQALSLGASKIGSGDLNHRVPVSGPKETRRLATAFNDMSSNLQTAQRLRVEHVLLRKLQAASLALASALSPEEVLRIISNGVRDILSCDTVWVLLADENMEYLETKNFIAPEKGGAEADKQISVSSMNETRLDLEENRGLVARTFKSGNPMYLDDVSDREDLAETDPLLSSLVAQLGITSLNLLPLRLPDRSLGIVVFGKSDGGTLSDEEKRVILVFAHQATISLERAWLHASEMQNTAELMRLDNLKSRLLHILSHELKTPLTSLKTAARLMDETDPSAIDTETQKRLLGSIMRATDRLIGVADDIYPIAGILSGTIDVELRETDFRRIVDAAVQEAKIITAKKDQVIEASDLPSGCKVIADKERLRQVLAELLTNAGKFSPEKSSIEIKINDEPSQITIDVRDHGIGISEEDQKSIFDGFFQADSEIVRRAGGKGLGLLFAKTIVERHHGRLWVDSQLGEGSNFHISIPKKV